MANPETIKYSGKIKNEDGSEQEFSGSVTYSMPASVEEAVQMWGEDVVLSKACASVVIDVQRICRASAEKGADEEQVQAVVDQFIPGVARSRAAGGVSKKALQEALKGLSKEELMALVEEAKARASA